MTTQEAFAVLRAKFGSDRECARFVGMSPQHYEALRNGRANMPQRTAEYILLKAAEVEAAATSDMPTPPPLPAQAGAEARV